MKQLIHSTLKKFGFRLVRIEEDPTASPGLRPFFALLKTFGFAPKHILDVGANRGFWTRDALRFFPDASYTLIEPQDHLKKYVEDLLATDTKIRWINAGASDHSGAMPITLAPNDSGSTFVLTEEQARAAGLQRILVPVRTLNEVVASLDTVPELVKIDAEGLDLRVLSGASDLLGKTDIFLVEAVVCASGYENSVAQVTKFMAAAGYRLVDITDLNRSPKFGVLWLCELAFLRNGCALFDIASTYE